nr:integrase, catalytic region, zinc finger, CCHC-type, peptidase aspartic, catalytic [Tanacetum cinerariifolium]
MSHDNTTKNRIWRTQRKAKKNKVEDHLRTVKSSLNKKSVVDSKATSSVVQIVLWYLDSGFSKHMTRDRSQLINFVQKFLGTVKFRNDHVAKIMGYGDYQIENVTISRVYYVEGLGHNLFSEKGLIIAALKDELRKLKGKTLVINPVTPHNIALEMLKIDVELIAPRLLNNKTVHSDYLRLTQEQAAILWKVVEKGKSLNPLNNSLDHASSSSNLVSNKPVLSSTGVKPSTSASGSQPFGNTKKDKIQRPPSRNQKNKVEAHPRTVKSSMKNKNHVVKPKLICVKCNGCMLSDNQDLCVFNSVNDVNACFKSKFVNKISKRKVWKPIGNVLTTIGFTWRPTGRTFTIVGNACLLTRITTTTEAPPRKPTILETDTPKPVVTLVYSRKPRKYKTNDPVSKPKIIKSISANNKEHSKS